MEKTITCIGCPKGCQITATLSESGALLELSGYSCPIGEKYAREEFTAPKRTVTSTVKTIGGVREMTPVKTREAIPKEHIMDVMHRIAELAPVAPIHVGDVLIDDLYGSALVATGENPKSE